MTIDSREFRRTLGNFATGITLITTRARSGALIGLTINSFSSVSLEPPLVLFCLARTASRFDDFMEAGRYAVNMLEEGQKEISAKFARHGEGDWGDLPMETWETGSPILPGALASLDCTTEHRFDAGDHVIMVGRVVAARMADGGNPLLYFRGAYRNLPAAG